MTTGALEGLLYCGNILIPSLFPFMVLSAFIVKSGFDEFLGRFLSPITKKFFHTDGTVGTVILLGLIGGFPVGAKGISTLYENGKISLKTAQSLAMFLVGGGPGFIVFVIGVSFYKSTVTGILLWVCQLITQIFMGIFSCRKLDYCHTKNDKIQKQSLSNSIVSATESGINSMMLLCGLVIIFSCIFGIFDDINLIEFISNIFKITGLPVSVSNSILSVLWEVTKGCNTCFNNASPIWLISFALGWGGVCVHFQIYSLTSSLNISKLKFTLYRFVQGIISAFLTFLIFRCYNPSLNVYSTINKSSNIIGTANYTGSIALVGMCILFIAFVNNKNQNCNE